MKTWLCSILLAGLLGQAPAMAQTAPAAPLMQQSGEKIFKEVCQSCHMPDAKGAIGAGAYPALADNPKLQDPAYPLFMVVNGNGAMPGFGQYFSNAQVAGVVNYIRQNFNKFEGTTMPEEVEALRPPSN